MERKGIAHRLQGLSQGVLGYGEPLDTNHALARRVDILVSTLLVLDGQIAKEQPHDSEHFRLQVELARTQTLLREHRESIDRRERELYSPPPATDPALDVELRTWFRGLSDVRQREVLSDSPDVLHALARFPAPDGHSEWARGLVRQRAAAANPDQVRALEAEREALGWAEVVTREVNAVIDRATLDGKIAPALVTE